MTHFLAFIIAVLSLSSFAEVTASHHSTANQIRSAGSSLRGNSRDPIESDSSIGLQSSDVPSTWSLFSTQPERRVVTRASAVGDPEGDAFPPALTRSVRQAASNMPNPSAVLELQRGLGGTDDIFQNGVLAKGLLFLLIFSVIFLLKWCCGGCGRGRLVAQKSSDSVHVNANPS